MTYIKLLLFIAIPIMLIAPFSAHTQDEELNKYTEEELLTAAREIIDASGTCALITLDEQSIPMVRIMESFAPESDFTVWFGTKAESRKVNQIRNNHNVTLYYEDPDKTGYVVIHGTAELIDNETEKQNRWKDHWENFYPNNREGYLLIKVTPDWMEILSVSRNITGDPITWETPVVKFY